MTRELLVLRHGKSDWKIGTPDHERPLANRGRSASKRVGRWLSDEQILPDLIISSPALRARQTTKRVCRSAGIDAALVRFESSIYEADLEALLEVLSLAPGEPERILIVGHNPGFDALVRHLSGNRLGVWDRPNLMPTAALARLAMPEAWDDLTLGTARCISILRPRELD